MNNQRAYNSWSQTYDAVENKTRDLETRALRESLTDRRFTNVLEIGSGTGKNTEWLSAKSEYVLAVDFSEEMLAKAKAKINAPNVEFKQFDLREKWNVAEREFDLISCSLALEHIENLDFVFAQSRKILRENGLFYLGELHPFKQYQGSKARFETGSGIFELECFTHHISDYFEAGKNNNFELVDLKDWFDEDDKTAAPRLLTLMFQTRK